MKWLILVGFMLCANLSKAQCDTTGDLTQKEKEVRDYIKTIKSNDFKGQVIANVISKDSINEYCKIHYVQKIIGTLAGLDIKYNGFITLRIHISQKDCGKFVGKASDWNMEEIKKCRVYRMEVRD